MSYGGSRYWVLIVDDFSRYHWSYLLRAKSGLGAVMVMFLQLLKTLHQIDVAFICLENSVENLAMASLIRSHGFAITFEYTSAGSPQNNGVVERAFATLYGIVRSMLNSAKVPLPLRYGVWPEAAHMATELKNLLVSYSQDKSPYELFHGQPSDVFLSSRRLVRWPLWKMSSQEV
jgi:hypothetical protein